MPTDTDFRRVSYATLSAEPEFPGLVAEYAQECSIPEIGEACPQAHLYDAMERAGGLHIFGIYDGPALIGFVFVLMYVLPHYGQKIATTESIFLAKKHRNSCLGASMLKFVEAHAKEQGCKVVLYTAPAGSRFARVLSLNRDKYRHTNSVFCRSLD